MEPARNYSVKLTGPHGLSVEDCIAAEARFAGEIERLLGGPEGVERSQDAAVAAWEEWDEKGGSDYFVEPEPGAPPLGTPPPMPGKSDFDIAREAASAVGWGSHVAPEDAYFQVVINDPFNDPAYRELMSLAAQCNLEIPSPELCAFAEKISQLCADAANRGGGKTSMIAAVANYAERATPEAKQLAALLTDRCASIAEHHNREDDQGAEAEIRAYFEVVSSMAKD